MKRIKFGWLLRMLGKWIQPNYWACTACTNIEYFEREILCHRCGLGEMIYKGKINA